jgi:hypothetical protein
MKTGDVDEGTVSFYAVRNLVWGGRELVSSTAARVAFTKSLDRLEARGLLRRERWFRGRGGKKEPTTWGARIALTAEGSEIVKRLTTEPGVTPVSRFDRANGGRKG